MSESTDGPPGGLLSAAWRPAGVIYLAVCLGGLAIGLWPGSIHPSIRQPYQPAPRQALAALAVAQAAFILLIYPLVLMGRAGHGPQERSWRVRLVEPVVLILLTAPLYVVAAYLSNAVAQDAIRSAVYAAMLFVPALAAGAWLAGGPGRTVAMLALAMLVMGLPAAWYMAADLLPDGGGRWLWQLGPASFAWDNAASRQGWWLPRPLWAGLIWPAVGLAAALVRLLVPSPARNADASTLAAP